MTLAQMQLFPTRNFQFNIKYQVEPDAWANLEVRADDLDTAFELAVSKLAGALNEKGLVMGEIVEWNCAKFFPSKPARERVFL